VPYVKYRDGAMSAASAAVPSVITGCGTRRTLLYPAGAPSVTVLAFIMFGDAVRDALTRKLSP
jgi:ABC-type dipeptide/oligopeptide/nickel transport system permease subunit